MDKKRKEVIMKAIKEYTERVTASPQAVKDALVREGIYSQDGTLMPQFKPKVDKDGPQ